MSTLKERLDRILAAPPTTAEEAEKVARAANMLAAYLRLEAETLELLGEGSQDLVRPAAQLAGLDLSGISLHDAAEQILAEARVPLHVRELGNRIKARGWKHPRSRDPRPDQILYQLAARLPRHPDRFVRIAPNTFALKEWDSVKDRPAPRLALFGGTGKPTGREIDARDDVVAAGSPWRSS